MKMKELLDIQFSHWYEWEKRESFQDGHLPGVYVIASFDDVAVPDGPGDPLDPHVIYIGEASRTLRQRWKDFEDAAFDPTSTTRRAKKYRIIFSGLNKNSLFTAAMTSSLKEAHRTLKLHGRLHIYEETSSRWALARSRSRMNGSSPT